MYADERVLPMPFTTTEDELILNWGECSISFHKNGSILLANHHASIEISASGELCLQAKALRQQAETDIVMQALKHIHLNSE
ncbi:MAG: hypothetical protein CMF50_08465 [Legionellales bacterium]|nr:hypothetical protein [Legionellales bacterium]|tara:strand:- start:3010 stop:3255 length:246 start_codon:yes stop_codon:yes gene_type:complete